MNKSCKQLTLTLSIFIHQAENALHHYGFHDGMPYWDWTLPMTQLPSVLDEENYVHPQSG